MSRINLKKEAERIAKENGLPPSVFKSLVTAESGWDVNAKSPVGARGLTQLMPATARELGVTDPSDPIQNLEGGARYLKRQLDHFGSIRLALAAYNAGPGNVENGKWQTFTETTRYVSRILSMAGSPTAHDPPKQSASVTAPSPLATQTALIAPPMIGGVTPSVDPTKVAFDNLGDIGRGGSPTRGLSSLVDAVQQSQVAPAASTPAPVPLPSAPSTQPVTEPRGRQRPAPATKGGLPRKPGGGWGGSRDVVKGYAALATANGLRSTSEKRDRQYTTSGNVSDHYVGSRQAYAEDLSNGYATPEMDKTAEQIASALGVQWKPSDGALELTRIVDGYRIQVLYRTHVGGDHFTHIHIGVKRVG